MMRGVQVHVMILVAMLMLGWTGWTSGLDVDQDTDVVEAVVVVSGCSDGSVEAVFADNGTHHTVVGCDHAWQEGTGMAGAAGACASHWHVCNSSTEAERLGMTRERCDTRAPNGTFYASMQSGIIDHKCGRTTLSYGSNGVWGCSTPGPGAPPLEHADCGSMTHVLTGAALQRGSSASTSSWRTSGPTGLLLDTVSKGEGGGGVMCCSGAAVELDRLCDDFERQTFNGAPGYIEPLAPAYGVPDDVTTTCLELFACLGHDSGTSYDDCRACDCMAQLSSVLAEGAERVLLETQVAFMTCRLNATYQTTLWDRYLECQDTHNANSTHPPPCDSSDDDPAERHALEAFYNVSGGPYWTEEVPQHLSGVSDSGSAWLGPDSVCNWRGLHCNAQCRVNLISLMGRNLTGWVGEVMASLGPLRSLATVMLFKNPLSGWLPDVVPAPNITLLDLSSGRHNSASYGPRISGYVSPAFLQHVPGLHKLLLNEQALSGTIPSMIGTLTRLQQLRMHHNSFSGTIPPEIGQLGALTHLDLFLTALSGLIPSQIGRLTDLRQLHIAQSQVEKYDPALPASAFQRLTNLETCLLAFRDQMTAPYFTCETVLYPYNIICGLEDTPCIEYDCQGFDTVDDNQVTRAVETFEQSGYWSMHPHPDGFDGQQLGAWFPVIPAPSRVSQLRQIQCQAGYGAIASLQYPGETSLPTASCRGSGQQFRLSGCGECAPGTYNAHVTRSACLQCSSGKFAGAYGQTVCTECEKGTFRSDDDGAAACLPASPGHYISRRGADAEEPCPSGQYSNTNGSISCTACTMGKYQSESGQSICTDASNGYYVDVVAATAPKPCPVGSRSWSRATACTPCATGTWQGRTGQASCDEAEPGHYVDVAGAVVQTPCPPGTFSTASASRACIICEPGTFQDRVGQTGCDLVEAEPLEPSFFISFATTSTLLLGAVVWFAVWTFSNRTHPVIVATSPSMSYLLLFGLGLIPLSNIAFGASMLDVGAAVRRGCCEAAMYLQVCGLLLSIGSLSASLWRLYKIFTNTSLRRMTIRDRQLAKRVCGGTGVAAAMMVAWSVRYGAETTIDRKQPDPHYECNYGGDGSWMLRVIAAATALLVVVGIVLIILVYCHAPQGKYNESRPLAVSVLFSGFVTCTYVVVRSELRSAAVQYAFLWQVQFFFVACPLVSLFAIRFWKIQASRRKQATSMTAGPSTPARYPSSSSSLDPSSKFSGKASGFRLRMRSSTINEDESDGARSQPAEERHLHQKENAGFQGRAHETTPPKRSTIQLSVLAETSERTMETGDGNDIADIQEGQGAAEEDGGGGDDYFEFAVKRQGSTLRRKTLAQQLREARMQSDHSLETCPQEEE